MVDPERIGDLAVGFFAERELTLQGALMMRRSSSSSAAGSCLSPLMPRAVRSSAPHRLKRCVEKRQAWGVGVELKNSLQVGDFALTRFANGRGSCRRG